jgi:Holliday junction resolvase RusA-like endonuclease
MARRRFASEVRLTELKLPFPPSVNDMYANNKRGGRGRYPTKEYEQWRADAAVMLMQQHIRPVLGRCEIWIDIDDSRQGDCDNRTKAVLDLLVVRGVIGGDQKKYVRRVSVGWAKCDGCRVAIQEIA